MNLHNVLAITSFPINHQIHKGYASIKLEVGECLPAVRPVSKEAVGGALTKIRTRLG